MLQTQWNTLKVGDSVHVHADSGELIAAVVAMVTETTSDGGGSNEVTVRVEDADECFYLWPSAADVHAETVEANASCVQCRELRG